MLSLYQINNKRRLKLWLIKLPMLAFLAELVRRIVPLLLYLRAILNT